MKKISLFLGLLIGTSLLTFAQEPALELNEPLFETIEEAEFWQKGQDQPYLLFRAVHAENEIPETNWKTLISKLDQKHQKKGANLSLLRQIFQKSHKGLFKIYEQHSSFNAMLSNGKFDCVSGSAALGLLLDRYGFEFDVIETDYHVFILVELDGEKIILESTLPVGGMITSPTKVLEYLESYKTVESAQLKSVSQRLGNPEIDLSDNAIFRKVSLRELAGLQYYNDAISHFNEQSFQDATNQLVKAYSLYPSERVEGLLELSAEQTRALALSQSK